MLTLMPRCSAIASDVIPDMIAAHTWASRVGMFGSTRRSRSSNACGAKLCPTETLVAACFTNRPTSRSAEPMMWSISDWGEPAGLAAAVEVDPIGLLAAALHQGETIGDPQRRVAIMPIKAVIDVLRQGAVRHCIALAGVFEEAGRILLPVLGEIFHGPHLGRLPRALACREQEAGRPSGWNA